jgi:hypothetical protein
MSEEAKRTGVFWKELRFQLSRSLLAFGGAGDSLAQVDGTTFEPDSALAADFCCAGSAVAANAHARIAVDMRTIDVSFTVALLETTTDSVGWNESPDEFRTCAGGCNALVRAASCL